MSNMLKKFRKEKKDYRVLYEIELENRKRYEQRYREKCRDYIALQKDKGIGELRKKLMEISDELNNAKVEISFLKEDRSKLYLQLEDTRNELEIERNNKQC